MKYTYELRMDIINDEEGESFTVYGIDVVDNCENIVRSVPDVFFDRDKAERFVSLCNREELDIIHLGDVIDDQLE